MDCYKSMENIELTLRLKGILKIPTKMNLFYDLVQKEIDKPYNSDIQVNARILFQVLMYNYKKTYCKCKCSHLQKYRDLYSYYSNGFFTESIKIEIQNAFGKIQKIYLALNRFAYIWKIKHATSTNTLDLFLNEIDPRKSNVLTIYQSKKLFYFTVKDFLNIVQRALCNSYSDFSIESLSPRNPYNKEAFQLRHYYNAYFQMRYKMGMSIPEVFQNWARIGFSLKLIDRKYLSILQKYAIKNFIWNVDQTHAVYIKNIRTMFYEYAFGRRRIIIDEDFPDDVLVEKTRGFMYLFYLMKFANLDEELYDYYNNVLIKGLRELLSHNPAFGRKQVTIPRVEKGNTNTNTNPFEKKRPASLIYTFNSQMVPFETRHL